MIHLGGEVAHLCQPLYIYCISTIFTFTYSVITTVIFIQLIHVYTFRQVLVFFAAFTGCDAGQTAMVELITIDQRVLLVELPQNVQTRIILIWAYIFQLNIFHINILKMASNIATPENK